MVHSVDAIFENGVLKPVEPLNLAEHQRVRVTIVDQMTPEDDRAAAIEKLWKIADQMAFASKGPYPTRESLYDRGRE
jgi:predicted DNA-binding antitoxin AbrB/MazE fold protein